VYVYFNYVINYNMCCTNFNLTFILNLIMVIVGLTLKINLNQCAREAFDQYLCITIKDPDVCQGSYTRTHDWLLELVLS